MNRIIDVHAHMFNGHYVPLRDIFYYKFGMSKVISKALSVITNTLVNSRPSGNIRDEDDNEGWKSLADYSDDDKFVEYFYGALADSLAKEMSNYDKNKVYRNVNSSELLEAYLDIIDEDAKEAGHEFDRNKYREELVKYLLIKDDLGYESKRLKDLNIFFYKKGYLALKRTLKKLGGHLSFVGKMLLHEDQLAEHLVGSNYDGEDRPALTIHLMMDMEPAFRELGGYTPPKLDFRREQIPRTIEVSENSNGCLLGFVAFDPRRGQESLEIVKYGLESGNIGVKLYPPMGYRPDNFNDFPIFHELYKYCIDHKVPIMVHCTPVGFDAKKDAGFGLNSDPKYWNDVLEEYNELILCFGHAGGGNYDVEYKDELGNTKSVHFNGWYEKEDDDITGWNSPLSYPKKIIELCQKYPNVYTDMSYLHAMIDNEKGERDIFISRLINAVGTDHNNSYDFGNKIMYGSDWHMSQIVNRTHKYLNMFQQIFSDERKLKPYADRFFFSNAVRYLRLDEYINKQQDSNRTIHSSIGLYHLKQIVDQA